MKTYYLTLLFAATALVGCQQKQENNQYVQLKPRVVVCTDIGQPDLEPDDTESLVRLLCYADQLEIEAIITNPGWNCDPYPIESAAYRDSVVTAYGCDVKNLMKRSNQNDFLALEAENGQQEIGYWPSLTYLQGRCVMGSQRAGIGVIGEGNDSDGSRLLIELGDEPDERPIYVCAWGGANTLAQAIWRVKQERTADELRAFVRKFRLFTITDQDMVYGMRMNLAYSSHQWLRQEFADDLLFVWDEGAWQLQCSLGAQHWADFEQQIQGHATLGKQYPTYKYGVEGDTPSFLNVIPNGLHDPDDPLQVGWGGYHTWGVSRDSITCCWSSWKPEDAAISTGYYAQFFPDIFRDFVARMEWAETGRGNHNPVAVVNGAMQTLTIKAYPGETITLDASASNDPDGDSLSFSWWQQEGIGTTRVNLDDAQQQEIAHIALPSDSYGTLHIICEVHDNGPHQLVAYRRVIIRVID